MGPLFSEPFTQADELRLQRLNAGLSSAKSQVMDGTLTPEEGQWFEGQIMSQRQPLLVQRQRAQAEAQQQMVMQAQQQNALLQGMAHSDQVFRAKGLPDRVAPFTDPITGATAFLFEKSPNQWEQITFEGAAGAMGMEGGTESAELGGLDQSKPPLPAVQNGPVPTRQAPRPENTPPSQPGQLEIWNGPRRETIQFDPSGRMVSRQEYELSGEPVQQADAQGGPGAASEVELREYRKRAERVTPPGPHWERRVSQLTNHLAATEARKRQHAADQQFQLAEAQRREQVQVEQKEMEARRKEKHQQFQSQLKDLKDERKQYEKDASPLPDYLKSHTAMMEEARKRMQAEDEFMNPKEAAPAETPRVEAPKEVVKPGPDLVKVQGSKLDALAQQVEKLALPPVQKSAVTAAVGRLRELVEAHGGDLDGPDVPAAVKEEAKQLEAAILQVAPKKRTPEEVRSYRPKAFGPVNFGTFGH